MLDGNIAFVGDPRIFSGYRSIDTLKKLIDYKPATVYGMCGFILPMVTYRWVDLFDKVREKEIDGVTLSRILLNYEKFKKEVEYNSPPFKLSTEFWMNVEIFPRIKKSISITAFLYETRYGSCERLEFKDFKMPVSKREAWEDIEKGYEYVKARINRLQTYLWDNMNRALYADFQTYYHHHAETHRYDKIVDNSFDPTEAI